MEDDMIRHTTLHKQIEWFGKGDFAYYRLLEFRCFTG